MTKVAFFSIIKGVGNFISNKQLEQLVILTYGIIQSKTVNISIVNDNIPLSETGCKNLDSQYKYLLKPFQRGDYEGLIKTCFRLLVIHFYGGEGEIKLILDRTNWQLGSQNINILAIGLLDKTGIFIPLVWDDLGYKGNSDSQTRINLIDQLLRWWREMPIPEPQFEIMGDREFIGEKWLVALSQREIEYVIRLRGDLSFETWQDGKYQADIRMKIPEIHKYLIDNNEPFIEVVLGGEAMAKVFIVKNESVQNEEAVKEPFIFFITNMEKVEIAAQDYRKRWKIEVCFKHLKSFGFFLEDFNMPHPHKTNILMAILTLAYAITVKEDPLIVDLPDKDIQYKEGKPYPRKSTFRKGLSRMTQLKSFQSFLAYWNILIEKLNCKLLILTDLRSQNLYVQ